VTWVAVAIGGSALIGAGASYAGAKKQSKAAQQAGQLNMDMFNTVNRQQQPFIQGGYGAMGKLNTLLGLNPRPQQQNYPVMSTSMTAPDTSGYGPIEQYMARAIAARQGGGGGNAYMPTPGGGVQPIMTGGGPTIQIPERNMGGGNRLGQLLALRAANGDQQAQQMLMRQAGGLS